MGGGRTGATSHIPRRDLIGLMVAGTLGRAPVVVIPIATLLLVAHHSTLTLGGFASGAASLGAGLIGMFLGRRLEGGRARAALVVAALLHVPATAVFIAVADSTNRLVLVAAGFAIGLTVPPIGPVVRARMGGLAAGAPATELRRMFAWDSLSVELSWVGAPLLVSLAIVIQGPALAVALSPALALVGVAATGRGPVAPGAETTAVTSWVSPAVLRLAVAFGLTGIAWRVVTIGVTELARQQGSDRWTGPLIAFWAFGSVVGAWAATRRDMPGVLPLSTAVGVTVLPLAVNGLSLPLTFVLVFIAGLPTAAFVAALNAVVTEVVEQSAHARAFSMAQAANTIMAAVGAPLAAWAIDRGLMSAVFVAGALLLAASGWTSPRSPSALARGSGLREQPAA
jgi:hypothetical protein